MVNPGWAVRTGLLAQWRLNDLDVSVRRGGAASVLDITVAAIADGGAGGGRETLRGTIIRMTGRSNSTPTLNLWSASRRPRPGTSDAAGEQPAQDAQAPVPAHVDEARSVFQQDYDRLLFSTPVRRLADKTQVWPMDENDGVRTRLTHSHEVANLARSIGTRAYIAVRDLFVHPDGTPVNLAGVVQPLLLATGLGHDLGNPPFGHQGEAAIGNWFKKNTNIFVPSDAPDALKVSIPEPYRCEFTDFDGNPQSLRLLTRLQTHIDGVGLNLSAATLAASIKYPVSFRGRKKTASCKKGGYFESERDIVEWVREETGLKEGQRHPLTWIMEACDDIAYSVLDIDDVLKKGMMSPDDVLIKLRLEVSDDPAIEKITSRFKAVEERGFVPQVQKDIKIQYLRALLLESLIAFASREFASGATKIFGFDRESGLMDGSPLCEQLKIIARENAFDHPTVLRAEALGAVAIDGLMTELWNAITARKDYANLRSKRTNARAKYVFSLISPNYIEQAVATPTFSELAGNIRYRELRLLTDMVSGMTDSFALRLWKDISSIPHVNGAQ